MPSSRKSTYRVVPRSWTSGTKQNRLIFLVLVGAVVLWVRHRSTPLDEEQVPPWARGAAPGQVGHSEELAKREAAAQEEAHAMDFQVDHQNHLQNGQQANQHIHAEPAKLPPPPPPPPPRDVADGPITFHFHEGQSCQNYAEEPPVNRDLDAAKEACLKNDLCNAIECPHKSTGQCTLRVISNPIAYPPADCYVKIDPENERAKVHPMYNALLKEYPFQEVRTQNGQQVNILLVRAPFGASGNAAHERGLYEKYKDEILFLGISSFEEYPLDAFNPFSPRINSTYFLGAFPGFLHMLRDPDQHFPPHVKTILMSQSDFQLPNIRNPETLNVEKKYDFTYAATWPLGPQPDTCERGGWASYCKNWSFVREALPIMCGERNLTGVLVATTNLAGDIKCSLPPECEGKITQTSFIDQKKYFHYLVHSRFAFIPQVHDASPRVSTQALVNNVPILMNKNIAGGWKYMQNDHTGETFHDMRDFRESLDRIMAGTRTPGRYTPRDWVLANYGNEHSGKRLLDFVLENFGHRVHLPKKTRLLLI